MSNTPWTRQQSEANADLNAQEFSNTQRLLRGNGIPNIPAPLHVEYVDESVTPNQVYRKTGPNAADWTPISFDGSGGSVVNGAVFITDIVPQSTGNVGSKVFSSGGRVLDSCVSDTDEVTISVVTQMGHTNYEPVITILGQEVTLIEDEDKSIFTGSIDVDRAGAETITASHEDGASHSVTITNDIGPAIQTAEFIGGKPAGQTELKEDDTMQFRVDTDLDMVRIEVEDFGAAKAEVFDFAATTTEVVTIQIADRGDTPQQLGVRVRAMNANGSFGPWLESSAAGSIEDTNVVTLNNLYPEIAVSNIGYPVGQQALKDVEQARISHTVSDFDSIVYDSPVAELNILNATTYETEKDVNRVAGSYNVDTDNLRIVATRDANGAVTEHSLVVQIAHVAPQITIGTASARLISGGNGFSDAQQTVPTVAQDHEVTVNSDQLLLSLPVISAPEGTLLATLTGDLNGTAFTQDIQIHDDDTNGTYAFVLDNATNLAGIAVTAFTGSADYEIGGFVPRAIPIAAFTNEAAIGTSVSDVAKLVALDKDLATLTYASDLNDALKTFSITGPSGVLNATGDLVFWNDQQAVNNNTTGGATITLEETV